MPTKSKVSDLINLLFTLDPDKELVVVAVGPEYNIENDVSELEVSYDYSRDRIELLVGD